MNNLKQISLFAFLMFWGITSCTSESDVTNTINGAGVNVILSIQSNNNKIETRAEGIAPLDGESTISNVYLLFYETGVDNSAKPSLFYSESHISKEKLWMHTFTMNDFSLLEKDKVYDVYVMASLPDATIVPTRETTKGDLLMLNEKQFQRTIDNPRISFTGMGNYTGGTTDITLSIDLVRVVARLDITFENLQEGIDIKPMILEAPIYTPYWTSGIQTSDDRATQQLMPVTSNTFRCYVYENSKDKGAMSLTVSVPDQKTGGTIEYTGVINKEEQGLIERNKIYKLTAVLSPTGGIILIKTTVIPWDEEVTMNPDGTMPSPFELEEANSYIVCPGGKSAYIPVSQANKAIAGTIGAEDILTTELVWTDVKGLVSGKGLAADASVKSIELIGKGANAVLRVVSGSQQGNTVIAVKGADGKIKWSWHIWVTDYDPSESENQITINNSTFMDRNLGALSNVLAADNSTRVIGNYYQWGRPSPVLTTRAEGTAMKTNIPMYDADGRIITRPPDTKSSTMLPLIQNPYTSDNGNNYSNDYNLWGGESYQSEKSRFDPCPAGWRIPQKCHYSQWYLFLGITQGTIYDGYGTPVTGYFPSSGFYRDNTLYQWSEWVYCATATRASATNFWYLAGNGYQPHANNVFNTLIPARCVRDWTKNPNPVKRSNEIRVLTAGQYQIASTNIIDGVDVREGTVQSDYLYPLLTYNFGKKKPMDVDFTFYSWSQKGKYSELIPLLDKYEIDIVYLSYGNATPGSDAEAASLRDWVAAKKNRLMIFCNDYSYDVQGNRYMCNILGFGSPDNRHAPIDQKLVDTPGDPVYEAIANGPYGSITSKDFKDPLYTTWTPKTELVRNGFIPLLSRNDNNVEYITLAVNPDMGIVLYGDSEGFGRAWLNVTKPDIYKTSEGEYPLLWANLWAWMAKTVIANR